jgi:hypothetical protein
MAGTQVATIRNSRSFMLCKNKSSNKRAMKKREKEVAAIDRIGEWSNGRLVDVWEVIDGRRI